jgi:hypothetical protein
MKLSVPFRVKRIKRREIPAFEKNGCVAQEVHGSEFVFVVLHSSHVEVQTPGKVQVQGIEKRLLRSKPGIKDSVLVGTVHEGLVTIVDALLIEQVAQRKFSWPERLVNLEVLHGGFEDDLASGLPLAEKWNRGLLAMFDRVHERTDGGLLLRLKGKTTAHLCMER